jgi:hypothetical protein
MGCSACLYTEQDCPDCGECECCCICDEEFDDDVVDREGSGS